MVSAFSVLIVLSFNQRHLLALHCALYRALTEMVLEGWMDKDA